MTTRNPIESNRPTQARHGCAASLRQVPMVMLYGVLGAVGVVLWGLVHMPMGVRIKAAMVYAVAGCIALCTMGWRHATAAGTGVRER